MMAGSFRSQSLMSATFLPGMRNRSASAGVLWISVALRSPTLTPAGTVSPSSLANEPPSISPLPANMRERGLSRRYEATASEAPGIWLRRRDSPVMGTYLLLPPLVPLDCAK